MVGLVVGTWLENLRAMLITTQVEVVVRFEAGVKLGNFAYLCPFLDNFQMMNNVCRYKNLFGAKSIN